MGGIMSYLTKISTSVMALAVMLFAGAGQSSAAEKINFVLNWVPGGDHSPV